MSKGMCFFSILALSLSCLAAPKQSTTLDYSKLQTKNLDEMQVMVQAKMKVASTALDDEDVDTAVTALRDALRIALSRPDSDNMVAGLVSEIRPRLRDLDAFEKTVRQLADEAMAGLKNKKEKPTQRATHLIVLENILGEFKPDVKTNPEVKKLFVEIRDAKIEIPDVVHNDMRLRGMFKAPASPSDIAAKIIATKPAKK